MLFILFLGRLFKAFWEKWELFLRYFCVNPHFVFRDWLESPQISGLACMNSLLQKAEEKLTSLCDSVDKKKLEQAFYAVDRVGHRITCLEEATQRSIPRTQLRRIVSNTIFLVPLLLLLLLQEEGSSGSGNCSDLGKHKCPYGLASLDDDIKIYDQSAVTRNWVLPSQSPSFSKV